MPPLASTSLADPPHPPGSPIGGPAPGASSPTPGERLLVRAAWLSFGIVVGWTTVLGVREFWACDDAFISFRYAQNLIDGHGLVYNAGERVEGYTNFSWTMLLSAAMALGAEPVAFANWCGLLLHLGTVVLLAAAAVCLSRQRGVAAVPLAAAGLAAHHHARAFASAGLETALFLLVVTALLLLTARTLRRGQAATAGSWLGIGLLGVVAATTRPDGMIAVAVAMVAVAAHAWRTRRWSPLLLSAAPWLVLWLPYFAWKWSYYGDPLPNTFYAKSADREYLSQGLRYLELYFRTYPVLLLGFVGLVLEVRRSVLARLLLAFTLLYLAFVAWVGGDFMFARFCLPVTPALLLGLELLRCRLGATAVQVAFAVVAVASIALGPPLLMPRALTEPPHKLDGVTEEPATYPREKLERARVDGQLLREATRGADVHVVIYGGQAMLAYYAGFPLVIEGATGLTDREVARRPIERRGVVGHEKMVPLDYALRRQVDLFLFPLAGELAGEKFGHLRKVDFGHGVAATILCYRREVVDVLRARGAVVARWEEFIDDYLRTIEQRPRDEVAADYAWLQAFYFAYNTGDDDRRRAEAFARRLQ